MRVTLAALTCERNNHRSFDVPVTVQIRPSRGMLGQHCYTTDTYALRSMLKRRTDLSGVAIDGFMTQLKSPSGARLSGVELNDQTLREIGYFVD